MDATYNYNTLEHELTRIMFEKYDAPMATGAQMFREREAAIARLREVVEENVERRHTDTVLKRLTVVADEMNEIWGIWDGWA
jgi:hypothetical protein